MMQNADCIHRFPGLIAPFIRLWCARGQTAVEYSLILGLVVLAVVLSLPALWWATYGIYERILQAFAGFGLTP